MSKNTLPVVLFGYASSTFTLKARLALRLKGIPYYFVQVPSMMPRSILRDNFHLTYRKIPVLAIGRDIYCDTSLIIEALESQFQDGFRSIYPDDAKRYRPLIRGFASYWTDRPLFRIACGLIPAAVWRSQFGKDRHNLIGHPLDADKLERKLPQNLSLFDQQMSMLEPLLQASSPWIFPTSTPSLADLSLFYELKWGTDIAAGRGMADLTAGEVADTDTEGATAVFNDTRYPSTMAWYERVKTYLYDLPDCEINEPPEKVLGLLKASESGQVPLIPTPAPPLKELDSKTGLVKGALVSIAPDDTGKDSPTIGELLAITPEEAVIRPAAVGSAPPTINMRVHFPRLGFVVRPVDPTR